MVAASASAQSAMGASSAQLERAGLTLRIVHELRFGLGHAPPSLRALARDDALERPHIDEQNPDWTGPPRRLRERFGPFKPRQRRAYLEHELMSDGMTKIIEARILPSGEHRRSDDADRTLSLGRDPAHTRRPWSALVALARM